MKCTFEFRITRKWLIIHNKIDSSSRQRGHPPPRQTKPKLSWLQQKYGHESLGGSMRRRTDGPTDRPTDRPTVTCKVKLTLSRDHVITVC
jgi:hypothetical protein